MREIALMFKDWWNTFKEHILRMKKPFIVLFLIYIIGICSIIRANYNYIDDLGRTAWGYLIWDDFARYITQYLAILIHSDTAINDISPFPQILAAALNAISSLILIKVFTQRFSWWCVVAVIPLGLSPFYLECMAFKFDAPYMALSILGSVFPLLFVDAPLKLYFIVLSLGTIVMLMTYQASFAIFIISLLFLEAKRWNKGKCSKDGARFVMCSGMLQICIALIFKLFVVKEYYGYVSTDIGALYELPMIILYNIKEYIYTLWMSSSNSWKVMFLGVCIATIINYVISSRRNKIKAFMVITVLIVLCIIISYGAFIILKKPLFTPRAFCAFGVFVAIMGILSLSEKQNIILGKVACCLLSWSLVVFALAYGNALAEQKRYESFRIQMVLNDVNSLPGLNKENVRKMQLKGSTGYSPVIHRMAKRYPLLYLLVPLQMDSGLCFGEFYFFHYFALPGVEQVPNWGENPRTIDDKLMPVFRDTAFHTIKADKKNIVVILKTGNNKYKSYN